MVLWAVLSITAIAVLASGQDVKQPYKRPILPLYKEKVTPGRNSPDAIFQSKPPPMGAGTYHYYDTKGTLHIANYVNDMYGFRILSEYTPFAPLTTVRELEKPRKPPKSEPRNQFNIETFDLFDEVDEPAAKPKKQSTKTENTTSEIKETADHLPQSSTVSEAVEKPTESQARMPSGTFKWPSYPSAMDMARPKAQDSKYFYPPRIFFYENRPLLVTSKPPPDENSGVTSTPEPPKEITTIPSTTPTKTEESPAQVAPTVSTQPFAGFYTINHSPSWSGRPTFPSSSTTGYSIRYGTANVQPFVPQLTSSNQLWPQYPQLVNTMNFGKATGSVLWGHA